MKRKLIIILLLIVATLLPSHAADLSTGGRVTCGKIVRSSNQCGFFPTGTWVYLENLTPDKRIVARIKFRGVDGINPPRVIPISMRAFEDRKPILCYKIAIHAFPEIKECYIRD